MNITSIRDQTPGLSEKLFLNSAGSSLSPIFVNEKIVSYLEEEEKWGGYQVADKLADQNADFYVQTAELLNTKPHNIAFAHDATDAYIKALSSIDFKRDDVIITSDDDYASNQIQFISLKKRLGVRIVRGRNLESGDLDLANFEQLIDQHNPRLVAITHVPTNSGLVQNVEVIGKMCRNRNVFYLVDACQSVGQMPVDVGALGCDFLTATGRKFLRGPRGTGLLYVSDHILNQDMHPLFPDLGSANWFGTDEITLVESAKRFETWERPYAVVAGLTEAVRYANELGMDNIAERSTSLLESFREVLSTIKGVTLYDRGSKLCNILTFAKREKSLEEIQKVLGHHQVMYSISRLHNGPLDFKKKGVDWVVRLSPHYFNTPEELHKTAEIIDSL